MAFVLRPLVGNAKHSAQNSNYFVQRIVITMKPEETIISYDVVGLFTSMPLTSALDVVNQALLKDTTLSNRTNLYCNKICDLLHLCMDNTYFSYNGQFHQQCHGYVMGSPVSPKVSNVYMEQFEHLSLSTYLCTGLQSWHRNVDNAFEVLPSNENITFGQHINMVHPNIKTYPG